MLRTVCRAHLAGWAVVLHLAAVDARAADEPAIRLRLGEAGDEGKGPAGAAGPSGPAGSPRVQPLTPAEIKAVLDRLPPLRSPAAGDASSTFREGPAAPRGRTPTRLPFPPAATPPKTRWRGAPWAGAGPLKILRRYPDPDGEEEVVPHVSVTFSQPMVPVGSIEDTGSLPVPVRIRPRPRGRWRWVGTQTVLFEPAGRLPMATDYEIEVPAGTRSAPGGVLEAAERWSLSTPAPDLDDHLPSGSHVRPEPTFFLGYDQAIDVEAVRAAARLTCEGTAIPLHPADAAEIAADREVRAAVEQAKEGHWLALRALAPLPLDSDCEVAIGPGSFSKEGPKPAEDDGWSFETYGPLRVKGIWCLWSSKLPCQPGEGWRVSLSNELDERTFRADQVRVDPPIGDPRVRVHGAAVIVEGALQPRTRYRVSLDPSLTDVFGQRLGEGSTVEMETPAAKPAAPQILIPGGYPTTVLDPHGPPRISVYTVNHPVLEVTLLAVTPEDWARFLELGRLDVGLRAGNLKEPLGREVFSRDIPVDGVADRLTETVVDLSPALRDGLGHVVVAVEAPDPAGGRPHRSRHWIQATRIGLDAFADIQGTTVWATSLADGHPLAGISVERTGSGARGVTDDRGLASLAWGAGSSMVLARRGADTAFSDAGLSRFERPARTRWYVFDSRGLFRPGDEIPIKGWLRRLGAGPGGDVEAWDSGDKTVDYVLYDARQTELARGTAEINRFGGFDFLVKVPATAALGRGAVVVTAENASDYSHVFQLQEFRRPEFEVKATASEGPHLAADGLTFTAGASYFSGGGLAGAPVKWEVTAVPGRFAPPGRDDFTFGRRVGDDDPSPHEHHGRTDTSGRHRLSVEIESLPTGPVALEAQATVLDVNRQALSAAGRALVHPADVYVGLKHDRWFVPRGEPVHVDVLVTDHDGHAVSDRPVALRMERREWRQVQGQWREQGLDPQDCRLVSTAAPGRCTFTSPRGGSHRVVGTVTDRRGRTSESELSLWVSGEGAGPSRRVEHESVTLIPDKKAYAKGDTAQLLVLSPFAPAEGVLTLRRRGIVRTERFRLGEASQLLAVKLDEGWTPSVIAQVDLVGAAARTDAAGKRVLGRARPAFASGAVRLHIPPLERRLSLALTNPAEVAPGGDVAVSVEVRDAAGAAVPGAEVALAVVDESVLFLAGYLLPDPIDAFYRHGSRGAEDYHSRFQVLLSRLAEDPPLPPGATGRRPILDDDLAQGELGDWPWPPEPVGGITETVTVKPEPPRLIALRSDFRALATFAGSLVTDGEGRATLRFRAPDSLTRYRVLALGTDGGARFGKGESTVTARLALMARPSPPRFLNLGDRFELPVVVQNETDRDLAVDVAVRGLKLEILGPPGQRAAVPAGGRVEVRFPMTASAVGTARIQVGAVASGLEDAAEVELPVWTPATTEATATYGHIDGDGAVAYGVRRPARAHPDQGGLDLATSSTALQALTDAVLYLVAYPHECTEQLSSRILAVAALRDVLAAFDAPGLPAPDRLAAAVERDLAALRARQDEGGGFGLWRPGDPWPYVTAHAAHALALAAEKGFPVPADMVEKAKRYLGSIEHHVPDWYSPGSRAAVIAYALHVRALLGDAQPAAARALVDEFGLADLSLETLGWLLPVLEADAGSSPIVAEIRRHLRSHVYETAATAHFVDAYEDGDHVLLHSSRRADAVLLEALLDAPEEQDLVRKLVEGLMSARRGGRWASTQENAFVLLALDRYFRKHEAIRPDFVARAWLGSRMVAEERFAGRSTEQRQVTVPLAALAAAGSDLTLDKGGPGRLYYRIGLRYAPRDPVVAALDQGFRVERTYQAVDRPEDVRRQADGTWRIAGGARVRVRVRMTTPLRRHHVALVDPLPAGLEPLTPELAGTGGAPRTAEDLWTWRRDWHEHRNLRDDRAEAFASLLWAGTHDFTYLARATTPGRFVVPPPKAEEMYRPETFGRGSTDWVVVEP